MKKSVIDLKNYLLKINSVTMEQEVVECLPEERVKLIKRLLKYPGELNLDERIHIANRSARTFEERGRYTEAYPNTLEDKRFWDAQKEMCYTGMLIDDTFYLPGDFLWYVNFIQIPDKVKRRAAFPTIYDTDIWWFQLLELAALEQKFTITLKKRQMGFSLKGAAKILKRLWFEQSFTGKLAAWDDMYNKSNWNILSDYKKFLQTHTRWSREFEVENNGNWKEHNLNSVLREANTKTNPAAVVSGKTDEIMFDEAGIAPNLEESVEFVIPALKFGDIITGEMNVFGAVGKLDKCEPLKKYFFNPAAGNFFSLPNIWSERPSELVGIFVPEYYSYGSYIDKYGNSLIGKAKEHLIEEGERIQKEKGHKAYMLYRSQAPLTPEDCFRIRSKNIFPTSIIQPHYEKLVREYRPMVVTLKEINDKVIFEHGSKTGIVTDYPVTFNSEKTGAVVIDEAPISSNPPFGLYYAATDPIKPINTDNSVSLQATYIYKAAHEIDGEIAMDKPVAWFVGRSNNPYETFETTLNLVKLYNARWAIENDQPAFIEWLIKEKQSHRLMKRSDMPILTEWVPTSKINEEIGWRTGSGQSTVKTKLLENIIMYCQEEISMSFNMETGEATPVYGVTRIKDHMLLKEMLEYNEKNADRLIAFGGVLMAARSNTSRGIVVTKKREDNDKLIKESLQRHSFRPNTLATPKFNSLTRRRP